MAEIVRLDEINRFIVQVLREMRVDSNDIEICLHGDIDQIDSPLRIIESGAVALAAQAIAIAQLHRARSSRGTTISIDCREIFFALKPFKYLAINGHRSRKWEEQIDRAPCSGHFRTRDGRHVYMANVGAKLRDATLRFLGCAPNRESVSAAIGTWDAEDLELAMTAQGIPVAVVRSEEEWHGTVHGRLLARSPLFPVQRVAPCDPVPLSASERPFSGLRVLDMTHVVAGPYITRALAEYGADVLHLSSARPELQDPPAVTDELQLGKRLARLELDRANDREKLAGLLQGADIFVHSWRPGVLERHGFTPERIAALKPGIVQLSVSCYGSPGPWSHRAGFDGVALASIGATDAEAECDRPKLSPPGVLTDSLAGFLGCGLVAALLLRRASEGGSFKAELSLARICMWLLSLGRLPCPATSFTPGTPRMTRRESALGVVDHVAPAISFSDIESLLPRGGRSAPRWP